MSVARIVTGRSAARTALPALFAVVVAGVVLRDRTWTHEWRWAFYQYNFCTVLLGPLATGLAAWDGWRAARSSDLLGTSTRPGAALAVVWAGCLAWVLATFVAGLACVVVMVKVSGTPGWPPGQTIPTALTGLGLLGAECAAGVAAGWWLRHPLAAPAATLGCFLTTLWLYQSGPGELVVVGGATSSLVNLRARPDMQGLQLAWFAAVSALLLVGATRTVSGGPRPGRWRLPSAGCAAGAALVLVLGRGETYLVPASDPLVCTGTAPTVCVAPGYLAHAGSTRAALLPYLQALSAIGAPVPPTFRQNVEPGQQSVGPLESRLLLGDTQAAGFAVLASYVSKRCPIDTDAHAQQAYTGLAYWLYATVDGERATDDPTVPAVVQGPPSATQRAWLLAAVADLRTCSR